MRPLQMLLLLLVPLLMVSGSPMFDTDMPQSRLYRALWSMNPKRSPSIGLSLAEYMAEGNQGHDQFHFIPSRK